MAIVNTRKIKWTEFLIRPGEPDIIVCVVYASDEQETELMAAYRRAVADWPDAGIELCSNYAGRFLTLPLTHRDKAYPLMTRMLQAGLTILTQTRMAVSIRAADFRDTGAPALTPEVLERMVVTSMRREIADLTQALAWRAGDRAAFDAVYRLCEGYSAVYYHASSWCTDEGRAFVQHLLTQIYRRPEDLSSDEEEVERPAKRARIEPPAECVICLVNVPDTRVEPCGHSVVCRTCSAKLEATPNAHVCVMCRQAITGVVNC